MQKNSLQIIWFVLLIAFISISYFFSLLLHLPLWLILIVIVTFGYLSYRWVSKNIFTTSDIIPTTKQYWSYAILLVGVIIVVNKVYYIESKYGGWDAWLIWNYHAKVLQHPQYWRSLFSINKAFHPDYPLFLSSGIAFFWRLLGTDTLLVPFVISFLFTLCVPVFLFLNLYQKNLLAAGLVLMLLATDDFYLSRAISQYADVPLAFLFLCAIVTAGYLNTNKYTPIIIGTMLGCCMWTKNEGIMLSTLFCLFYAKDILSKGRWKYFFAGIAVPLITLFIFKSMAPINDLLGSRTTSFSAYFSDTSRYHLIWTHMADNVNNNFIAVKIGLIIYAIICIVEKKWPDRNMLLLFACVAGYFFVYVFTNQDLEWHLQTSMDRVLLQLMPSFVYVIALQLCRLKIVLPKEQLQ